MGVLTGCIYSWNEGIVLLYKNLSGNVWDDLSEKSQRKQSRYIIFIIQTIKVVSFHFLFLI